VSNIFAKLGVADVDLSDDATLLLDCFAPGRRGPRPRGCSRADVEEAFPAWEITDAIIADADPDPLTRALGFDELFYRPAVEPSQVSEGEPAGQHNQRAMLETGQAGEDLAQRAVEQPPVGVAGRTLLGHLEAVEDQHQRHLSGHRQHRRRRRHPTPRRDKPHPELLGSPIQQGFGPVVGVGSA
jgi:hypothetical protein